MKKSHVFNPKKIDVLEDNERKVWQNPDEILEMIEIRPTDIAVDIGCGSGFFTIPLSLKAGKIYAIDFQNEMLDYLKQKIQKLGIKNIIPLLSEGNDIPLESNSVDLIISVNTLHEFGDRKKIIQEMERVLKNRGKALIVDFKKEDTGFGPLVSIRISKEQAKDLFKKNHLKILKDQDILYHYVLVFSKEISTN